MLDWFNCMLEFIFFLLIHISICETILLTWKNVLLYGGLSVLASLFFARVQVQILPVNVLVFLIVMLIPFRDGPFLDRLYYALCSIMFMLIGEFAFLSFLPPEMFHEDVGNLIVNLILVLVTATIFFYIRRKSLVPWIARLFRRYWILMLFLSFGLILLGQVFLSRLSQFWTFLPGIIMLCLLAFFLFSVSMSIRHQMSTDRLRADTLEKQVKDSEAFMTTVRTQMHDYKHHIQYLLDEIQTARDLKSLQAESLQYTVKLDVDRALYDRLMALESPVLRAAVFGCYAKSKEAGIPFFFDSTAMLPIFPISDYQLVEVIENLIQNAIEHNQSLTPEQRYIRISMKVQGALQSFSIDNPIGQMAIPLSELYLPGRTTKSGTHQGLGLSSVRKILSENGISFSGTHDIQAGCIRFEIEYEVPS